MNRTKLDRTGTSALNLDASTLRTYQDDLTRVLGPVVGGAQLAAALGYRTQDAFTKAHQRGRLPIRTFAVKGRRGRFAATADIAVWLWAQRNAISA